MLTLLMLVFQAIEITYNFRDGVCDNGVRFIAAGFPRICYIPNCQEGPTDTETIKTSLGSTLDIYYWHKFDNWSRELCNME